MTEPNQDWASLINQIAAEEGTVDYRFQDSVSVEQCLIDNVPALEGIDRESISLLGSGAFAGTNAFVVLYQNQETRLRSSIQAEEILTRWSSYGMAVVLTEERFIRILAFMPSMMLPTRAITVIDATDSILLK